jgi:hypothetical protein
MPTIHKPQLDHASFPWHDQSNKFRQELEAQRLQILERSGFNAEFGDPADASSNNTEKQGTEFIRELSGILSLAAAIKMDAGYKPTNKLIATLKSIEANPTLILTGGVEPEALGRVARNYQRGEDEPGTFWFDVDQPGDAPLQYAQGVSKAASIAIRGLEKAAQSGRPRDVMLNYLGNSLLACFLRFNETATRHSIASDGSGASSGWTLPGVFDLNRWALEQVPCSIATEIRRQDYLSAGVGAPCPAQPGGAIGDLSRPGNF